MTDEATRRAVTIDRPERPRDTSLGGIALVILGIVIGGLLTLVITNLVADPGADGAAEAAPTTITSTVGVPGGGPVLAAYATRRNGQDHWTSTRALQEDIGRDLGIIRVFERWDSVFPRDFHHRLRERDQQIILSVRARNRDGSEIRWRDIAAAQPGDPLHDRLREWVRAVAAYDAPVYFTFHHEADAKNDNPDNGSPDDFIAAWRRIVDEFRAENVTNVEFVLNLTGGAFSASGDRAAERWYPGDRYVDHLSADLYNWFGCRNGFRNGTWRSLEQLAAPFLDFARDHPDKGLFLSEFGSAEDPNDPQRKAQWFDEARELFKRPGYERFVAISYFNSHHGAGSSCAWFVDSSPLALAAFQRFAADPFYR